MKADARETPRYGVREAAAYVGVARSTLRHWLAQPAKGAPIIQTPDSNKELSFYNLLEAHVLLVAVERDVKLERLRVMVDKLRERAPDDPHPLLSHELFTGGPFRSVFLKTFAGEVEDLGHGGQFAFSQLVTRFLKRIDFDNSGPYRLRPYKFRHIALDHRVSGGLPVVLNTGIMVKMIARRARAGETVEFLARDYHISTADVREAIKYAA
jgi:uncharacterized protein (DUF433 family)